MNKWAIRLGGCLLLFCLVLVLFSLHRQLKAMADAQSTVAGPR